MSFSGSSVMKVSAVLIITFMLISGCRMKSPVPDCDLSGGPCVKDIRGYRIVFYTEPAPPATLKDTVFRLEITPPVETDRVVLELSMPGMYMGENRIILKRSEKRTSALYKGEGIIVRCPSGATLWQADFRIPDTGKVSFRFHVAY